MKMSDIIAQAIIQLLDESADNTAQIQRNEFAEIMGCVPSQINYVLGSRFTPEHGYQIESFRGGGGCIRISRVQMNRPTAIMHIVNSIGSSLDATSSRILIDNCIRAALISEDAARMIIAATSNHVLSVVDFSYRDKLRAAIVKQMLLTQVD